VVLPALKAGRTVWLPMPLDVPHTFTYTGDVARMLVRAARDGRAWGRAWHVPSPAPMTVREFVRRVAQVGGFAEPRVRQIPLTAVRAAGLFNKFIKELLEMRYQVERPFILDDSRARQTFDLSHTDIDEAIRASIA
jgi:nucleoside-diphosphate-sugar epimerase